MGGGLIVHVVASILYWVCVAAQSEERLINDTHTHTPTHTHTQTHTITHTHTHIHTHTYTHRGLETHIDKEAGRGVA